MLESTAHLPQRSSCKISGLFFLLHRMHFTKCCLCPPSHWRRVGKEVELFSSSLDDLGVMITKIMSNKVDGDRRNTTHFKLEVMSHCKGGSKILTASRI